jgi:hypothetical protein
MPPLSASTRRGAAVPIERIDEATAKGHDKGAEAARRLQAALQRHGITFPSLYGGWPVNGTPMVELGGCRADVAEALAVVLEAATPKGATE